jgi:hypothetical protein
MLRCSSSTTRSRSRLCLLLPCVGAIVAGCGHRAADDTRRTPSASAAASVATTAPDKPAASAAAPATAAPSAPPDTIPAKAEVPPHRADRIYSKARFAWIQPAPRPSKGWLGYLGLGGSVAVRGGTLEGARIQGSGSCKAWYAVEPVGYVCAGDAATVDPNDPVLAELAADAPHTDSPWPYDYAESMGAPRFTHAPSAREQQHDEWDFAEHMRFVALARTGETVEKLAGVDLSPAAPGRWGATPDPASLPELSGLVREGRKFVATGSTVATTRSFELGGRTFVVTHDHAIVPKDRLKPYPRSEFQGVELGGEVQLPLAFFRKHERPKYRRGPDGAFALTGDNWPRLAWVGLTGEETKDGDHTYLATREAGTWVLASDAAVVRLAEPPSVVRQSSSARKTWVDVSVLGGTLVAYEDAKPVFATLISPGRGGIPAPGKDPLETASTPTGTFRVDGKFVTATMVSSTNDLLVHTEVQYVQNFHGPHALHGAYWHDAWGQPKSGGCVNLAPIDAKRLFAWSEPHVPEDWYGMRSVKAMGPATVVVVHK